MNVAFIFCPPHGGAFIIVPLIEGVQGEDSDCSGSNPYNNLHQRRRTGTLRRAQRPLNLNLLPLSLILASCPSLEGPPFRVAFGGAFIIVLL